MYQFQDGWDMFCFKCHINGASMLPCSKCTRSYHYRCLRPAYQPAEQDLFVCPDCLDIEVGEKALVQQKGNKILDVDELAVLLQFILNQMKAGKIVSKQI